MLFSFLSSEVSGGFYVTPVTKSNWNALASRVECSLKHEIPDMGVAAFSQQAGETLSFELQPKRSSSPIVRASLAASAPSWMHEAAPRQQHVVLLEKPDEGMVSDRLFVRGTAAESMLEMLKAGWFPKFTYVRETTPVMAYETQVVVSAVNFRAAYETFSVCRNELLPFAFDDVRQGYLFYENLSTKLDSESRQEASMIAEYLSLIPDSSIVMMPTEGEVGKKAKKRFNARAGALKAVFGKRGVKLKRVKTQFKDSSKNVSGDKVIQLRLIGSEVLRMIFYPSKKASFGVRQKQRLDLLVLFMKEKYKTGAIVINGHTDSEGSERDNKKLSAKRIEVIKQFLISKGVSPDRVRVKAWGERRPASSNRSRRGRANNRRVQIDFVG